MVLNFFWKKIKHSPITVGSLLVLSWNPMVLWSFKIPITGSSLNLICFKYPDPVVLWFWKFSNTQNQQFFDSQIFKCQWVLHKSNTHPTLGAHYNAIDCVTFKAFLLPNFRCYNPNVCCSTTQMESLVQSRLNANNNRYI